MADVLIRNVDDRVIEKFKKRAAENGRSLQSELKELIEESAPRDLDEFLAEAAKIRAKWGPRPGVDSVQAIREDRER